MKRFPERSRLLDIQAPEQGAGSLTPGAAESRPLTVALTGATGYVGGRLGPRLLEAGHAVRCLVRSPGKLSARPWSAHERVRILETDLRDVERLTDRLRGCNVAYYLVHSMQAAGGGYARADDELAGAFGRAAAAAGVGRIIYLGGLGEMGEDLSEHLSSRRRVEAALGVGGVPVTVLRAAMIIGSGSASFEILRYLVERLPVMITPKWVFTESQPIAIRDVLHYLVNVLDDPATAGQTLDIGGPQVISYRKIMDEMSDALGLRRRWVVPVPVLTPRLSSLWIHLVTPIDRRLAQPLAEGLRNRVVCRDDRAHRLMPGARLTVREAIDAALGRTETARIETAWSDAGVIPGDPDWAGGTTFTDEHPVMIQASPDRVFDAVCRVGGGHGYYAADYLWRLRGMLDRLLGGPGLRRGRRHPRDLSFGDALDFWRVIAVERPGRLSLIAEMKLPGAARLDFVIEPDGSPGRDACTLRQRARFKPRGLAGLLYWFAVLPLHGIVFRGMLNGIRRVAEGAEAERVGESEAASHSSRVAGRGGEIV